MCDNSEATPYIAIVGKVIPENVNDITANPPPSDNAKRKLATAENIASATDAEAMMKSTDARDSVR
jgi:hypothetical protein